MFRHAVGVAFLVALVTSQDVAWKKNMTMMVDEDAVKNLLEQYRNANQAQQADSNRDGRIDQNEFSQSLYIQADANRDGRVDQSEFMDSYRRRLPFLPSEVIARMFDLLDDLNNDPSVDLPADYRPECNKQENVFSNVGMFGDNVLTQQDVTLDQFTSSNNPSVQDFQTALNTWVEAAVKRIAMAKKMPFKVGKPYDVEYDYDLFFDHVDTNKDDIITNNELAAQLTRFAQSGSVSREDWVRRNVETYGQNRDVAMVIFDYLDFNNDLTINSDDVREIIKAADANMDERTTKQELYRFMQRKDKTVRRMLGLPIKPFVYDCPEPVWRDGDACEALLDVTLLTMDADYNFDGNITAKEMRQHMYLMDRNMDGEVDRVEFVQYHSERYGMDMRTADMDFDAIDMDGDGKFSWDDYEDHLKEKNMAWTCVCEYRLSALASARAVKHLAEERKKLLDLTRMKYFVLMNDALRMLDMDSQMPHAGSGPWSYQTMNGKPAKGGCTACTAKDNWGMTKEGGAMMGGGDGMMLSEEEMKMMEMLLGHLKQMTALQMLSERDATWRMMHMLMHAMNTLRQHVAKGGYPPAMGWDSEIAQWMMWKVNTMKVNKDAWDTGVWDAMGQGQGQMGPAKQDPMSMLWPGFLGWQDKKKPEEKGAFDKFLDWHRAMQDRKKEEERKRMEELNPKPWPVWPAWQGWGPQEDDMKEKEEKEEKEAEEKKKEEWERFMAWYKMKQGMQADKSDWEKFMEWQKMQHMMMMEK